MADQNILIKKASGEFEPYLESKLTESLRRAGAGYKTIQSITGHLRLELKEGMSTADIYKHAFTLLRRAEKRVALRYNLKRALMEMGPTGHPFEKLIGAIFQSQGYKVVVATTIQGGCITHEVDVLAQKDNVIRVVEAKYHNALGVKSDVKVALYVHARFLDIKKGANRQNRGQETVYEPWIVTNTKFSNDAVKYGECNGLHLVGWNYPRDNNLQDMIEGSGVHPISSLSALSRGQKRSLLEKGLVLCKDVPKDQTILSSIGIDRARAERVFREVDLLCGGK